MNIQQTSPKSFVPILEWFSKPGLLLLPLCYLLAIVVIEFVHAFVSPLFGLTGHILFLLMLVLISGMDSDTQRRRLSLTLILISLSRILTLIIPVVSIPQEWHLPVSGLLILIACGQIVRQLGFTRAELGLAYKGLLPQLALAAGGFSMGAMAYGFLQPQPMLQEYSWQSLLFVCFGLILITGFGEEFIYRGLLQASASYLGAWSVIYIALLYSAMFIIVGSPVYLGFVFLVSLLFGQLVRWSGSLLGVSLAHAIMNVVTFVLMPYLHKQGMLPDAMLNMSIAGSAIIALIGLFWFAKTYVPWLGAVSLPERKKMPSRLRKLRNRAGLTIVDLSLQSGLSAVLIAEIESGWREPSLEQLDQLVSALREPKIASIRLS